MSVDNLHFHQALQLAKDGRIHDRIFLSEWCTGEKACAVDHTDGKNGHWRTTTSIRTVDVIQRLVEERDAAREALAASLDNRLKATLDIAKAELRAEFAETMIGLQQIYKDKSAALEDSHSATATVLISAFDKKIRLLENQVDDLAKALQWYVDSDETNDIEENKPWLEGKKRARAILEKIKRGILG